MRTARVLTNLTCSQACTYCTFRRPEEDRGFVSPRAVERRIADAIGSGAVELVLSGGEPTMRSDLASLVRFARRAAEIHRAKRPPNEHDPPFRTILETHAGHVDEPIAAALRAAGLDEVRVNLSGPDAHLDDLTRDPGGFERTAAGIRAFAAAGIDVLAQAVLVKSTLSRVADVPATFVDLAGKQARGLLFVVPVESPDPAELVRYEDAAPAIVALERAARAVGLPIRRAPESGPPPCVLPDPAKLAPLFAMTEGGKSRPEHSPVAACASCQVETRCPGFPTAYLDRHGTPNIAPIKDDRTRRRLSVISTVEDQIRRELVQPNRYQDQEGRDRDEDLIRVNFHCNQTCRFCFVSTHLPKAPEEAIERAILEANRRGHKVTISGGEPTLNPRIAEYIALAKQGSKLPVQLQTNAVKIADKAFAERLVAAGLDEAFVSLHASTAALSDDITNAPGTFEKTVIGVDHLDEAGVVISLNFVIHKKNAHDLPAYVRFVAARWPRAFLNISFVAPSTDVVPRDPDMIPRYTEVMPYLEEALREAESRGLAVGGFESMCGIPLCLVPGAMHRFFRLPTIPDGFERGELFKTDVCKGCALEVGCYGIRRGYAALHGTGELRAVRETSVLQGTGMGTDTTELSLASLEIDKLEACVEIMFLAAIADGQIDEAERAAFEHHVALATAGQLRLEIVQAVLRQLEADLASMDPMDRVAKIRERLPDMRMRRAMLEIAAKVAAADGVVRADERTFLTKAAEIMGMGTDEVDRLLSSAETGT